ncbi:MAG: spermidine/putrescine ABC transporter substrate-binding protein, partial [Pseudomonadota bacterium]
HHGPHGWHGPVLAARGGYPYPAQMLGYPGFAVTNGGRTLLNEVDSNEAQRTGQVNGAANDPVTLIDEGRIHYRGVPAQQSLEDWNDFWSEYKNA